jgi:hypothetical protein
MLAELSQQNTHLASLDTVQRFDWLSGGDVAIEQRLLAHIVGLEKRQSGHSATELVTEFMQRYEAERASSLALFRHIINVGNQKLQIEFSHHQEKNTSRDTPMPLGNPAQYDSRSTSSDTNWFGVGMFLLLAFIIFKTVFS